MTTTAAAMNGGIGIPPSSSSSSTTTMTTAQQLKTYFKTPEGRYKLRFEKSHPSSLLHYTHGKSVSQVTLAHLKEKPASVSPAPGSSFSASGGMRYAAKLLGAGNGGRTALGIVGVNGATKAITGTSRNGFNSLSSGSVPTSNYDGKGTYLIFNVGDTIYISDLNSHDKDPIKSIHFGNSNPVCHAFDPDAKDGHDLLIGLNSGDVYSVSLRPQLQDVGKKLVGAQHYNKDGSVNSSRCTSIAWIPGADGAFIVAHADGNMFVYEKGRDGTGDSSFPMVKDASQFCLTHAKSSKVSAVAFDPYWSPPSSDGAEETIMYRFGSVGQDTQLLLWDFSMDEIVVPLRRCPPGGSPTYSTGSQSSHWDNVIPLGTLQPSPKVRDVPKLSPLVAHRVYSEPLSGLIFTEDSVLTACREGHIKVWMRPEFSENQSVLEEKVLLPS
ncbi:hypothetical protein Droror1_Dr00017374 [Drosera rotundifolia]